MRELTTGCCLGVMVGAAPRGSMIYENTAGTSGGVAHLSGSNTLVSFNRWVRQTHKGNQRFHGSCAVGSPPAAPTTT